MTCRSGWRPTVQRCQVRFETSQRTRLLLDRDQVSQPGCSQWRTFPATAQATQDRKSCMDSTSSCSSGDCCYVVHICQADWSPSASHVFAMTSANVRTGTHPARTLFDGVWRARPGSTWIVLRHCQGVRMAYPHLLIKNINPIFRCMMNWLRLTLLTSFWSGQFNGMGDRTDVRSAMRCLLTRCAQFIRRRDWMTVAGVNNCGNRWRRWRWWPKQSLVANWPSLKRAKSQNGVRVGSVPIATFRPLFCYISIIHSFLDPVKPYKINPNQILAVRKYMVIIDNPPRVREGVREGIFISPSTNQGKG